MKRILVGLSSALILTGCGASIDDLVTYTQQVKANTQVNIEPYPAFTEFESVDYAAQGTRSPFQRATSEQPVAQIETTPNCTQPDRNRTKEKLERFGLDALQMAGVLAINGKRFALIKANDQSLHRVAIGNYVGLFHGRVTQISDNEVKIQEMLPDGAGCWQPKTATISMSSAAGEEI
ncbi:pilus assembly protein PilP [Glaciecola siphonariae]|uniref:Type IV secretion system putative lipoprotein virB7 n=1 Tax=Glaciecola siphonariae TaxID=521012 RepID=A0ABV9LZ87_9ALTE